MVLNGINCGPFYSKLASTSVPDLSTVCWMRKSFPNEKFIPYWQSEISSPPFFHCCWVCQSEIFWHFFFFRRPLASQRSGAFQHLEPLGRDQLGHPQQRQLPHPQLRDWVQQLARYEKNPQKNLRLLLIHAQKAVGVAQKSKSYWIGKVWGDKQMAKGPFIFCSWEP